MRTLSRALVPLVCALMFLTVFLPYASLQAADSDPAPVETSDAVVALGDALANVNGALIERTAFDATFARIAAFSTAADPNTLALDVLNSLINERLLLQFARANELVVEVEVVNAEVASLKDNLGDDRWEAWLAENLYSEDEFWHTLHGQFITLAVRDHVTAHLQGPVEHFRARHILVAQESEAQRVIERLNAGDSFAALAAAVSLDVSTRDYGGDLGWFIRGELLDPRLGEAAFSLALGEIGGPIATRLGYHVLQVIGVAERRIEAGRLPYLTENTFNLWLEAQVEAADIHLNLEALDTLGLATP